MHAISLGLLLIEAHWPEPTRDMVGAKAVWANIFRSADLDGDEYLSVDEAVRSIGMAQMDVDASLVDNVWSYLAHTDPAPVSYTHLTLPTKA